MDFSLWMLFITLTLISDIPSCSISSILMTKTYKITEPDGTKFYCNYCDPGTYWTENCVAPNPFSTCTACPKGRFQNTSNTAHSCAPCHGICPYDRQVVVANCTSLSDLECRCDSGFYWSYPARLCLVHDACEAGRGVVAPGTPQNNTKCKACRVGHTFSPNSSLTQICQPCSECHEGLRVKLLCTQTNNTMCHEKHDVLKIEFIEQPKDAYLIAGHPARLHCIPPVSVPTATVTWYKDGKLLVPRTGQQSMIVQRMLSGSWDVVFEEIQKVDEGQYFCVAMNNYTVPATRTSVIATISVGGDGWSTGDIVGLVLGVVIVLAIIIGIIACICKCDAFPEMCKKAYTAVNPRNGSDNPTPTANTTWMQKYMPAWMQKYMPDKDVRVPHEILRELSRDIISLDWQFFIRCLFPDVQQTTIDEAIIDNHSVRERIYQLLLIWRNLPNANLDTIIHALGEHERPDLVEKYQRFKTTV